MRIYKNVYLLHIYSIGCYCKIKGRTIPCKFYNFPEVFKEQLYQTTLTH